MENKMQVLKGKQENADILLDKILKKKGKKPYEHSNACLDHNCDKECLECVCKK